MVKKSWQILANGFILVIGRVKEGLRGSKPGVGENVAICGVGLGAQGKGREFAKICQDSLRGSKPFKHKGFRLKPLAKKTRPKRIT